MDDVLSSLLLKRKNKIIKIHDISYSLLSFLYTALQHITRILKYAGNLAEGTLETHFVCCDEVKGKG